MPLEVFPPRRLLRLDELRGQAGPGDQVFRGREPAHVQPDLGQDHLGGVEVDTGDVGQSLQGRTWMKRWRDRFGVGGGALARWCLRGGLATVGVDGLLGGRQFVDQVLDAGGEAIDLGGETVDLAEQDLGEFGVVVVEPAVECPHEFAALVAHVPLARSASVSGLRSPRMSASIISRTDIVVIFDATAVTLISASSSSFSSRCQWRVRSRVRSTRVRV